MIPKQSWSSKSIGSRLQHNIFYGLIHLGGRKPAYALLFFVVLWYTARPQICARSASYLSRRFPASTRIQRLWHTFRLNWEFGKSLVDRAAAGILKECISTANPEDKATMRSLFRDSKGLILLSGHVGCWQTATATLAGPKTLVHIVMYQDQADVDRQYFEHSKQKTPISFINPQGYLGGTLEMTSALKRGHILCMMGDRVFGDGKNTVCVDFLGGKIHVPVSAYRLASATGTPILVCFSRRTGAGRAKQVIAKILKIPPRLGRTAPAYRPYAQEFAAALEQFAWQYPYQFFNFYDMWENKDL